MPALVVHDLVYQARAGDHEARTALLQRGERWLRRFCRIGELYLPHGGDRDDLVQAGLLGWNRAIDTWNERDPFLRWARYAARSKVYDMIRSATGVSNLPEVSMDEPAGDGGRARHEVWRMPDPTGVGRDPATIVAAHDTWLTDTLLQFLSPTWRQAVQLVWLQEIPPRKAHAMLGISVGALESILIKARRKLFRFVGYLVDDPHSRIDGDTRRRLRRLLARGMQRKTRADSGHARTA